MKKKETRKSKSLIISLMKQFTKYGFIGLLGTVINTLILILSVEVLKLHPMWGSFFGFVGSLIISFFLNTLWTFQNNRVSFRTFFRYTLVSIFGFLINLFIILIIVDTLSLSYLLAQVISVIIVPMVNFLLNKLWTFEKSVLEGNR